MRMVGKDTRLMSGMWATIAVLSALALGACAQNVSKPESGESSNDVFTAPDGTVTESATAATPSDIESEKAGCTHIRFCNQGGRIVCDTNDSTSGSCADPATRCFECCSDARAVCGTANPITFDPGFPGTCTCG